MRTLLFFISLMWIELMSKHWNLFEPMNEQSQQGLVITFALFLIMDCYQIYNGRKKETNH